MKSLTPDPPVPTTDLSPKRYMPLTGNDCTIPALFVDTEAPLDVLHEAAAHRIRAVAQLLENLAAQDEVHPDPALLQDFAQACVIPLRDGCDLLDVIGRRLQAQIIS